LVFYNTNFVEEYTPNKLGIFSDTTEGLTNFSFRLNPIRFIARGDGLISYLSEPRVVQCTLNCPFSRVAECYFEGHIENPSTILPNVWPISWALHFF